MKLLSLKLLHYRRFRKEEVIFQNDFSLVFWKNWAWKSSVLDAIWYALFGPSSRDFVRVNRDFLRSYFLNDREPSKIELIFQYWLENYRVIRVIDPWTKKFSSDFIVENKDTLYWANWLEIIGWDEITKYIEVLIWVNKDTFLRSVFAKQKDLEVLSGWLSDRKELIQKVLWLDKIENIIDEFKLEEKDKKQALEIYKKRVFDFDLETLTKKKDEKNLEIKNILEKLISEQNSLKILNDSFIKSKTDFEHQDQKRQKFIQISNQAETLKKLQESLFEQNKNISLELEKIEKKEVYLTENKIIIEKEKTLKLEIETKQKDKLIFNQKLEYLKKQEKNLKELEILNLNISTLLKEDLPKQIEKLELEQKENQTKKEEILKQKIELDNKINYLRKEYEELKGEFENIKKLANKADCPTCKRPLDEYFPNLLKLYEEKLLSKASEWKDLKQNFLQKIENSLNDIIQILEKNTQLLNTIKTKEKDLIRLLEIKSNLEKNIEETSNKIKEIWEISFDEEILKKLQGDYLLVKKEYESYLQILWEVKNKVNLEDSKAKNTLSFEQNNIKLETYKQDILTLKFNEENYQKIKEVYFSLNTKINEINTIIQEINTKKLTLEFELKTLQKQEEDFKDDKKQIDFYLQEVHILWLKRQIMADYITYLLWHLKPRIEDLASEYFAIITDNKYSSISLDSDYNIMIDEKNIDLYSWWERDLANLCLRLSLGQNLTSSKWNPINFLILDEVLASQDKDRQQNILVNLKKLENKFSQIILISHLEEIKDLATNLIEIKAINREESCIKYY